MLPILSFLVSLIQNQGATLAGKKENIDLILNYDLIENIILRGQDF